jgi:hypothetical protein
MKLILYSLLFVTLPFGSVLADAPKETIAPPRRQRPWEGPQVNHRDLGPYP